MQQRAVGGASVAIGSAANFTGMMRAAGNTDTGQKPRQRVGADDRSDRGAMREELKIACADADILGAGEAS